MTNTKHTRGVCLTLLLSSLLGQTIAFSPSSFVATRSVSSSQVSFLNRRTTLLYSSKEQNEDNEEKPPSTPSFTNEPEPVERLDPLIQSLTRIDPQTASQKTVSIPLIGEFPIDGSALVLVPVAIIAVLGFVMSIQIAISSKDLISQQIDSVTNTLSQPAQMRETKVPDDGGCRGLCSSQDESLDTMRSFMEGLGPKKGSSAAVIVESPAVVIESKVEAEVAAPAVASPEEVTAVVEEATAAPAVATPEEVTAVVEEATAAPATTE